MKDLEIQLGDRVAKLELVTHEGNNFTISIDGRILTPDIVMVERGVYSIILEGRSYNVELIESDGAKKYSINTIFRTFEAEVLDAESKYLKSRKRVDDLEENTISSPMPGKVVRILVKPGDHVKAGETVIIVSAMKMESEYKVRKDRLIKDVKVKVGDTVSANQPLIVIE